jgi:Bacterial Ig-like domain (group 1)
MSGFMRHWSGPMTKDGRLKRNTVVLATFLAGGIFFVACHESETVAPDGATITLSANPAQVIIANGVQSIPVTVLATVRDTVGVPLPGQDVRFTTTNGILTLPDNTPAIGVPVPTDHLGNAVVILTGALQAPQITATSGKATANLSLTAGTAPICFITLTPSDAQTISNCDTDTFDFTVHVEDCSQKVVAGARIFFEAVDIGNKNAVPISFNPSNGTTDVNGDVTTTMTPQSSQCNTLCSDPQKDCKTQIHAKDASGLFVSNTVDILDGIQ